MAAGGHTAALPRGGLTAASLDLESGAMVVRVTSQPLGDDLIAVSTAPTAPQVPQLTTAGASVTVHLGPAFGAGGGGGTVDILLNAAVTWSVRLNGGSTTTRLDARAGGLTSLELAAGASNEEISLGHPVGTLVLIVTGGAAEMHLHLPREVPVRLRTGGGASSVTVDGVAEPRSQSPQTVTTPGYESATDRVDVDLRAGVGTVTVDRGIASLG